MRENFRIRSFSTPLFLAFEQNAEAVAKRWSVKKVFLDIPENSEENTCVRVSFLLKKRLWSGCFPVNFAKFLINF